MTDFRVAKIEASASLYLTNSTVVRGTVFLAEFSATHSGHETMLDLVRSSDPMLPMLDVTGRFILVGRQHVVALESEASVAGAEDLTISAVAELETTGAHVFRGDLHVAAGPGDRVSDALNGSFTWHALVSGARVTWISRRHIIKAKTE